MSRLLLLTALFLPFVLSSQSKEIVLNNPSFEDIPHQGTEENDLGIRGWYDCGEIQFPFETPPDIHPVASSKYEARNYFQVKKEAQEGATYLGLVVRDNDTWESVSQRLSEPLLAGTCYEISAYLAQSETYKSGSKEMYKKYNSIARYSYKEPTVLRIWAGTGVCERTEILAESRPVSNIEWEKFTFKLEPSRNYQYITFEAFYEVPVLLPYRGHILVDNISSIVEIPCNDEVVTVKPKAQPKAAPKKKSPPPQQKKPNSNPQITFGQTSPAITYSRPAPKKEKKVSGLGFKEIKKGQIIKIENLYFLMDESEIQKESHKELDKLYSFLKSNDGVVVEIGGHTNTAPPREYCLKLSKDRAKAVTDYLIEKGIKEYRIKYKGYGKSHPIIKDDKFDMAARKKNQRVEIKILELGS